MTRDLSLDGAFFVTEQAPPVGSTISFAIALADLARLGLAACCEGVVVRTEPAEGGSGVAVHITALVFDSFANWTSHRTKENRWH